MGLYAEAGLDLGDENYIRGGKVFPKVCQKHTYLFDIRTGHNYGVISGIIDGSPSRSRFCFDFQNV